MTKHRSMMLLLCGVASAAGSNALAFDCKQYSGDDARRSCEHRPLGWAQHDDCETLGNHTDRGLCKQEVADLATRQTEVLYAETLASARKAEFSLEPTLKDGFIRELTQSQETWRRFRDLECRAEADVYGGGTMRLDAGPACSRTLAEERRKQLEYLKRTLEQ